MHPLNPFNLTTSARPIRYFAFALLGMTLALTHVAADPDAVPAEKSNPAVVGVAPGPQGDGPAVAAPPPKARKKKKAAPRSVPMMAVPAEMVPGIGAAVKSPPAAAMPALVAVPAIEPPVAGAVAPPASGVAQDAQPPAPAPPAQDASAAAPSAQAASTAPAAPSPPSPPSPQGAAAVAGAAVAAEAVTPVAETPAPKQRRQLGMRSTNVKKTAAADTS